MHSQINKKILILQCKKKNGNLVTVKIKDYLKKCFPLITFYERQQYSKSHQKTYQYCHVLRQEADSLSLLRRAHYYSFVRSSLFIHMSSSSLSLIFLITKTIDEAVSREFRGTYTVSSTEPDWTDRTYVQIMTVLQCRFSSSVHFLCQRRKALDEHYNQGMRCIVTHHLLDHVQITHGNQRSRKLHTLNTDTVSLS